MNLLDRFAKQWEKTQIAIAFAQAGRFNMAKKILEESNDDTLTKHVSKRRIKTKGLVTLVLGGLITGAIYAAVFMNYKVLTQPGIYGMLPIVVAFAVSLSHGAFTSVFWDLLGITHKKQLTQQLQKRQTKRVDKRPRLHLHT